jgi:hypothetical protein
MSRAPRLWSAALCKAGTLSLDVWISADWTTHVILDENEFEASPLIASHPELAAEARRAARFLSELTPQRLQALLASSSTALAGRECHHRPT